MTAMHDNYDKLRMDWIGYNLPGRLIWPYSPAKIIYPETQNTKVRSLYIIGTPLLNEDVRPEWKHLIRHVERDQMYDI